MAGSVQFCVHRALLVISDRSVLLPPAFAAGIRMSSHSDAPRSPVVAVWADFSAKVDEEVWSAHERGSVAPVSWSHCTVRVFQGYPSPPPIPRSSCHQSTTLSQFPAYQHRLTHHFIVHLIAPEPHYPTSPLPIRPPSSPTRAPPIPTSVQGLQPSPPTSTPPSPLLYPRPPPKVLF